MNAKGQLEAILTNKYESEDGDMYQVEVMEGMSTEEIYNFRQKLPSQNLPNDIEELLRFSKGFEFYGLEEVQFDTFNYFGFVELFPRSIQLAGDGFGNFWILDIDLKGNWNSVYFVCHDPAVVVKQAENLSQFISQVDEYGSKGGESTLGLVHDKVVFDIWNSKVGIMEKNEKIYDYDSMDVELPETFLVADLVHQPIMKGFSWGKWGPNPKIVRLSDDPIWAVEKTVKQGWLSRIFWRKK